MRICIPTEDDRGLDARVYGHFGSAPFFAMVDTDSGEVEMVENAGSEHQHGQCKPVERIDPDKVDAVVCHGLGRRAWGSLKHGGVDVLVGKGETVRDILIEARDGRLVPLDVDETCAGGRHPGAGGRQGGGRGCQ